MLQGVVEDEPLRAGAPELDAFAAHVQSLRGEAICVGDTCQSKSVQTIVVCGGTSADAATGAGGGGDSGSDVNVGTGAGGDSGFVFDSSLGFPCCKANGDPCWLSLNCGAPVTAKCTEKMACEADGEAWNYSLQGCARDAGLPAPPADASRDAPLDAQPGAPSDAQPGAPSDAQRDAPSDAQRDAPSDAQRDAPSDAQRDAPSDAFTFPDVIFCCNANGDPCCPSLYCGAPVTVQCTQKMACESDGGTRNYGLQGCDLDAGPRDATSDAPEVAPADAGVDGNGHHD